MDAEFNIGDIVGHLGDDTCGLVVSVDHEEYPSAPYGIEWFDGLNSQERARHIFHVRHNAEQV